MGGLLTERDCYQLRNAGRVARENGTIGERQTLTCPHMECDRINCILLEEPNFRRIYIRSAQTPSLTQLQKFDQKIVGHFQTEAIIEDQQRRAS